MDLHFEEVYAKGDPGDEYEAGFQLAKDFPNHKIKRMTSTTDDILFMFYQGDEPTLEEIECALKDQKMEEWFEVYLADVNDQINDEMDDLLHNT